MSGHIVRAGKRSIAFGLLWAQLPGVESSNKEIKKLAQDHGASDYVRFQVDGKRILIGLLPKASLSEKGATKAKASAAGAVLATIYKGEIDNAVFGIVLPNNHVAIIGFRNGSPLVGFDRVIPAQGVDEVVAEYLQVLKEQASTTVFYGRENIFKGRNPAPFELNWFEEVDQKRIGATRLVRVKKPVGLIVALVIVVGAAGFGLDQYEQYQFEQARKAKVALVDPNIRYEQSVSTVLAAAGHPAINVAWQMIESVNRLPLFHQGWRLEMVTCNPGTCTVTWANSDGGTYQSFTAAALPGVTLQKLIYTEGLISLETTIDYPLNIDTQGVKQEAIPSLQKFVFEFGSFAQTLKGAGIPVTLEKAKIIGLPPSPPGQPQITENILKNPIKEGGWTVTGDWLFSDALRNLPSNMTINTLVLGIAGDSISMTATGKYYVKN